MSLAEGVSCRIAYKAYATGAITSNSQPTSSTDPGASGGQILRRVASSLSLGKESYRSGEIRSDRQIAGFRHGVKRVTGALSGEFSPLTYKDLMEAACRGTWAAAISKTETEFTDVVADNATSKFTFGGGNPVTEGFRIGMVVRFSDLSEATNNAKNFVIVGFGGTNSREVTVYPAPTTMSADVAFTVASIGKSLIIPASGHVSRKFAFEHYYEDLDRARLFSECRIAGMNVQLPATGNATIDFPIMGRDVEAYSAGSAPFFTAPTAQTTTGIFQAVNGLLRVGGSVVGVVTGLTLAMNLAPSSDAVLGQNFVPEIYLGPADLTGQFTALLEDDTFLNDFKNETDIDILAFLTTTNDADAEAVTLYLPSVVLIGADNPAQGIAGQVVTCPFQAKRYEGAGAGIQSTTIQICDTEVV